MGYVLAFSVVLALIGLLGWLVHHFGSKRLGAARTGGRQPRLALIDAAIVDERRRLILIRRDNVEHLLMIGGPTDIVVEQNILRAAAPARPPALAEATQRPTVPNEGTRPPPVERTPAASTPPLLQRQSPMAEEPVARHGEMETLLPSTPKQPRPFDRPAGSVEELPYQPAPRTAPRAPPEREATRKPPENAPAEATFTPATEPSFAEMIEAALRHRRKHQPGPGPDPEPEVRPRSGPTSQTQTEPKPETEVEREPVPSAPAAGETGLARDEAKLGHEDKTASPRPSSIHDSLANLLERPDKR